MGNRLHNLGSRFCHFYVSEKRLRQIRPECSKFRLVTVLTPLSKMGAGRSVTHSAAPDSVTGIQPGVGPGPTFNYGMNQRINFNLSAPANVPETPFKITQAVNPWAFVVFSEQRVHASETPYFGNSPADLSSTFNWCNRFSGRHTTTGNIVFGDAHVAGFRYGYVVGLVGGSIVDPKRPDINWEFDGK